MGGLGLNLTGADTVIFLEHDWNPMKDLQVNVILFNRVPATIGPHLSTLAPSRSVLSTPDGPEYPEYPDDPEYPEYP